MGYSITLYVVSCSSNMISSKETLLASLMVFTLSLLAWHTFSLFDFPAIDLLLTKVYSNGAARGVNACLPSAASKLHQKHF